MYQTQFSIHSVISISLTQKIFNIKLVKGSCQDIAGSCHQQFFSGDTVVKKCCTCPRGISHHATPVLDMIEAEGFHHRYMGLQCLLSVLL